MNQKKKSHKRLIIILSSVGGVLLACVLAFFVYFSIGYQADATALSYMKSDEGCTVIEKDDCITFSPEGEFDQGIIFYSGAKVEEKAYTPLMHRLADSGIAGVIIKLPFHFALFSVDGADNKQSLFPSVTSWYLSGHSLGGVVASMYLGNHSDDYQGLIDLASYSTTNLSKTNLRTLSITATNDKVLKWDNYEKNKANLPQLTEVSIIGGIHSYFGSYGIQSGDGAPEIDFDTQLDQIVAAITSFVK